MANEIISYLDVKSLSIFTSICKKFYSLFRSLFFSQFSGKILRKFLDLKDKVNSDSFSYCWTHSNKISEDSAFLFRSCFSDPPIRRMGETHKCNRLEFEFEIGPILETSKYLLRFFSFFNAQAALLNLDLFENFDRINSTSETWKHIVTPDSRYVRQYSSEESRQQLFKMFKCLDLYPKLKNLNFFNKQNENFLSSIYFIFDNSTGTIDCVFIPQNPFNQTHFQSVFTKATFYFEQWSTSWQHSITETKEKQEGTHEAFSRVKLIANERFYDEMKLADVGNIIKEIDSENNLHEFQKIDIFSSCSFLSLFSSFSDTLLKNHLDQNKKRHHENRWSEICSELF